MDINKEFNQEFNRIEIINGDEKTKQSSMDFTLMASSESNQKMKITVNFTQKFKEIAFKMLEEDEDNHGELLEELKNNIKLSYNKDGEDKNWFLDIRPVGYNIGYLE